MNESADKQEYGKLIVSAAKSLKDYRIADPQIAAFLYGLTEAGQFGLFTSSIRGEHAANIQRIRHLAAAEGIGFHKLITETLPWLETAGLCHLERDSNGDIEQVTSLVLSYKDLLGAVTDFYFSREPSMEDQACLKILAIASRLPVSRTQIRHSIAAQFTEQVADVALNLAESFQIVAIAGQGDERLLYAPRVWTGLNANVDKALSPLDDTQRELLTHLINLVRENQGYPEVVLRQFAVKNGINRLVDMSIGIGLLNRTDLVTSNGTRQRFLTTPHFYSDLADEFGEDMCDRVKVFLDSIRHGQFFTFPGTGQILDPESLLRALIDRGEIGPATAIGTDYLVAEKAGIVRVRKEPGRRMAYMELRQVDTARKVLEIVTTGSVEPGISIMGAEHVGDGTEFRSIEQGRAALGKVSAEMAEVESEIITQLRE